VALYFIVLSRKKKAAMRYGNLSMVKSLVGARTSWRRHVPPVLYVIGLALTILAIARPTALIAMASNKATIILAMDVSGSMRAAEMKPTRLAAAQEAAKAFIKEQPKETLVGIVAFASTALVVQNPTTDKQALDKAIDRFELQRGTAMGSGMLMSLSVFFPEEELNLRGRQGQQQMGTAQRDPYGNAYNTPLGGTPEGQQPPPKKKPAPVPPGSLKTAILILMTDGANTAGPDPEEAAKQAADHGLRVYTIGFGTKEGDIVGFAGRQMRAQLDDEALKNVADMTRGQYFQAGSADELKKVYQQLSKQRLIETKETEITAFFAAAAAAFTLLSAALSLLWFNRIF
jgi:Ca-activated chloride channel family protein